MRTFIAITLGLGLLAAAACGSSNKFSDSCDESGGTCLNTGASCGDTLPYACPSGGVCCSPKHVVPTPSSSPAPAPTPTTDAGH